SKYEADPFNEEKRVKILHQTAKVKWFKEGDRNSAFFHSILKARKHKSKVESICGEDGQRFMGSHVADEFVSHFKKKFRGMSVPVKPLSELGDIVQMKLNEDEAKSMIGEISE
ncbi:hypothetical protein Tco_0457443, partial [Tanacetum coccineum]